MRRLAVVVVMAVVALTGASCADSSTSKGDADVDPNGTLRFADTTSISSFDPIKNTSGGGVRWLFPVFDTLIGLDPQGELVPGLAESWEFTDPTTLRMTLREADFQDGSPVDGEAVKTNLLRTKSLVGTEPLAPPNAALIDSVTVVDPQEIEIKLTKPAPAILFNLASNLGMMVSPASLESSDLDTKPVGAGMFEVSEFDSGQKAVYTAWDGYWDPDAVRLKSLELELVTDSATRLNALTTGQFDLTFLDPTQTATAESRGVQVVQASTTQVYTIFTRVASGTMMANKDIRRAIMYALDRQTIVDTLLEGHGRPTVQIFAPEAPEFNPDYPVEDFDNMPDEARRLIADSGVDLEPLTLYVFDRADEQQIMQVVQSQLEDVGFDVELLVIDPTQYSKFTDEGCCDGGGGNRRGDPDPLESIAKVYGANGDYHPGGMEPEGINKVVEEILATEPGEERDQLLQEASGLTVEDPHAFPLFARDIPYAMNDCVVDFEPYANGIDQYRGVGVTEGCE